MSTYKRKGIYHCDFTVNGERYRQTLETTDWREAKKREDELKARAREGKLASGLTAHLSRLPFCQALDQYLAECLLRFEPGNAVHSSSPRNGSKPDFRKTWEGRLTERLRTFFASKRLNQITADDIRLFQAHRLGKGKHPATIKHETKALLRLLKRAKLASSLRDEVRLLTVRKEPKTMLTEAEKQRVFETAARKPGWQTAYWAAVLTANSTMRPVELRRLQWRDIDPFQKLVTVRRSKTDAGSRVIPLNPEAWNAIAGMKSRADVLGTYAPENHVFHRLWPKIEPGRPMAGWRSAWRTLRKSAAAANKEKGWEEMPKLAKLRFYDLRHQAITEMLEAGVPEGVIREIAGHVDPAMTMHYSHPRLAARRAAVETLVRAQAPPALESHVTKCLTDGVGNSEVLESIGTPGGIRTPDLLLRRQPLYPSELQAHS